MASSRQPHARNVSLTWQDWEEQEDGGCGAPAMGSSTSRPSPTTSTIVPLPDGASASGSDTVTCKQYQTPSFNPPVIIWQMLSQQEHASEFWDDRRVWNGAAAPRAWLSMHVVRMSSDQQHVVRQRTRLFGYWIHDYTLVLPEARWACRQDA